MSDYVSYAKVIRLLYVCNECLFRSYPAIKNCYEQVGKALGELKRINEVLYDPYLSDLIDFFEEAYQEKFG